MAVNASKVTALQLDDSTKISFGDAGATDSYVQFDGAGNLEFYDSTVGSAKTLTELVAGDYSSPLTTKGDIFTWTDQDARLAVGTDGQYLKAASGEATGLIWDTLGYADMSDFQTGVSANSDVTSNTAHTAGDGSDHADVATNSAHVAGDGSDHADVATNSAHVAGDGSDHADVATNSVHVAGNGSDHAYVGQDLSSSGTPTWVSAATSAGSFESIVASNATLAVDGVLDTGMLTAHGLLTVIDDSNDVVGIFRLEGTDIANLGSNSEFSTAVDTASKVNVYFSTTYKVQNKTAGTINVAAGLYGRKTS